MIKFYLRVVQVLVVGCVMGASQLCFAACPVLVGTYQCPGFMTLGAFEMVIVQTPGAGFMQYDVSMKGGYVGNATTKSSVEGFKNEDGALSSCDSDKVVVKTKVEPLGDIEGQVYLGAGNTVRVTLVGATPEPWEALVCKRIK